MLRTDRGSRWWRSVLVLFFSLFLVASSAAGQYQGPSHLASEVTCSPEDQPQVTAFDSAAISYGITERENARHEATHVRQLAAGGCAATLSLWRLDPLLRLEAEVEATCEGLTVHPAAQATKRRYAAERVLFDLYARLLPVTAGPPFGLIHDAFERWC